MTIGSFNSYHEATAQDYKGQIFLGRVVSNSDPLGIGRFKVSVPGLYENGQMPWVGTQRYSPFGVGPGFGFYGSPAVGSTAILMLQDGDAHMPICIGFLLSNKDKNSAYASPTTWGYVDPSGTKLLVDTSAKTWTWTHASGTTYTVAENGDLTATVVGQAQITIDGNATVNVGGTTSVTSTGAATLTAPSVKVDSPTSEFTGNVKIDGNLLVLGTTTSTGLLSGLSGMTIIGDAGGGNSAYITGNVIQTSGFISSNGIILHTHIHVDSTGHDTGQPINS